MGLCASFTDRQTAEDDFTLAVFCLTAEPGGVTTV